MCLHGKMFQNISFLNKSGVQNNGTSTIQFFTPDLHVFAKIGLKKY